MKKRIRQISLPAGMECDWVAEKRIVRFPAIAPFQGKQALALLDSSSGPIAGAPIFAEIDNLDAFAVLVESCWQGGIRLKVNEGELGALHSNRNLVRRPRTEFVLDHKVSDPGRTLIALAPLKSPVFLSEALFINAENNALDKLIDKVLYSPFLAIPVHPFLTLLQVLSSGKTSQAPTFWDMFRESAGKDYYLEENGQVTLGDRWAKRGLYMGQLGDTSDLLLNSEVYMAQAELSMSAFAEGSQCSVCPEFFLCQCYFKANDSDFDCNLILTMVQAIRDILPDIKLASRATRPAEKNPQNQKSATVFVSNDCPNNCLFCAPADSRKKSEAPDHFQILTFIKKCGAEGIANISFSGAGEPTLNPKLTEYVSLANELGLSTILFTNGYALNHELLEGLIGAGLKEIMLSIHGHGSIHDQSVGRLGSFKEVERAMALISESALTLHANTCLLKSNLSQIEDILNFTKQHGCVKHSLCFPEWDGNALHNKEMLPTYEEIKIMLAALSDKNIPHLILDNIPSCLVPDGIATVNKRGSVMYRDLDEEKLCKSDFNFGRNIFVKNCKDIQCKLMANCCGLDKKYLNKNSFPITS